MSSTALAILPPLTGAEAQQAAASVSYSIPAGKLSTALTRWAQASGIKLLASAEALNGRSTTGLSGSHGPQEALATLLAGTGLTYTFSGSTVTISDPGATGNSGTATVPGAIALDTIDVSGGGAAAADVPFETAGSTAHLSREQIDRVPPVSVGDIFRSTPGVMASTNRAGGSNLDVNIRGLQGMGRVGITIDGAMQSFTNHRGYAGVSNSVYVDPDLIGGIDVSKGPASAGEAVGSIGGVVAMRTLNADDIILPGKDAGVRIRGSTSSNMVDPVPGEYFWDTYPNWNRGPIRDDSPGLFEDLSNIAGSMAMAARIENVEIVVAGSQRKTGNYFSGTKGETTVEYNGGAEYPISEIGKGVEVLNTQQDVTSGLAKLTWKGTEQFLETGYIYYKSEYGENSPFSLRNYTFPGGYHHIYYYQAPPLQKQVDTYTVSYGWSPSDNDLVSLRVRGWASNLDAADTFETTVKMYGGEVKNTSRLDTGSGPLSLEYGTVASFEEAISALRDLEGQSIGVNGERTLAAIYANAEWKPMTWLTLAGGLRGDYYRTRDTSELFGVTLEYHTYPDLEGTELSPRASVMIEPRAGVQVFGQYEEGVRAPSLRESGWSTSGLHPNPNLKPERAKNLEFGFNLKQDGVVTAKDAFRLKTAYFINNYDDYLSRAWELFPDQWGGMSYGFQIQNIDRARFEGVELTALYDARIVFAEGTLNYYNDIEFCSAIGCGATNEADYGTNHVPPKFTGSFTLGTRLLDEKLTLGGRVTYVGERGLPLQQNSTYGTQTEKWVPYTLVDAFASYKFNENLQMDFAADNLFDRYYVDALNNLLQPAPGRTMTLTATARF